MDQAETLRELMQEHSGRAALPALAGRRVMVFRLDEDEDEDESGEGDSAARSWIGRLAEELGASDIDLAFASDPAELTQGSSVALVLGPGRESFWAAVRWMESLRRLGILRANLIVSGVTNGREAQGIFAELRDWAVKNSDIQLGYIGHWERIEKSAWAVMKRKFLLDWNEADTGRRALRLLAKRIADQFENISRDKVNV